MRSKTLEHVKLASNLEFDVVNGDYQGALDAALKEHPEIGLKYNNWNGHEPHIKDYSEYKPNDGQGPSDQLKIGIKIPEEQHLKGYSEYKPNDGQGPSDQLKIGIQVPEEQRTKGYSEYEADSHEKDSVDAATNGRNTWDNIKEEMSHYSMDAFKAHTEEYKDYLDYRSAQIRTEKGVESTPVNNFVSKFQAGMESVNVNLKNGPMCNFDDRGQYDRQTGEYNNTHEIDWGTDDYAMSRGANPTELGVASIREKDSQFANRELPCVEGIEVGTDVQLDL